MRHWGSFLVSFFIYNQFRKAWFNFLPKLPSGILEFIDQILQQNIYYTRSSYSLTWQTYWRWSLVFITYFAHIFGKCDDNKIFVKFFLYIIDPFLKLRNNKTVKLNFHLWSKIISFQLYFSKKRDFPPQSSCCSSKKYIWYCYPSISYQLLYRFFSKYQ